MADHFPLAEKLAKEVDAFFRLWRSRRGLAVAMVLGLLAFGIWSISSIWIKGKQIDRLEGENSRLEAALRESDRENRGLRETVAPLLARAAKEFPGEEINASLKKIVDRLETDRPGNRPLASASVAIEVIVDLSAQVSSSCMDCGVFFALGKGSNAVITASSAGSLIQTIGTNRVRYNATLQMPGNDQMLGKPLRDITESEYLQIEFFTMPENKNIIGGKVDIVLNGSIHAEFKIPAQKASGRLIFVGEVQDVLRSLLQ